MFEQSLLWAFIVNLIVDWKRTSKSKAGWTNSKAMDHNRESGGGELYYCMCYLQSWCFSSTEMLKAMEDCLSTIKALAFLLNVVYDIKEWLSPHAEEIHDHTQPKCFKFVKSSAGKCEMFYRNYSHMPWEGPVILLKVWSSFKPVLLVFCWPTVYMYTAIIKLIGRAVDFSLKQKNQNQ